MTDQELGMRIKGGDELAFTDFYHRHSGWVFSKALHMLKSPQDAEEAVQDVFARVWQYRESWDGVGGFGGWFYAIIQNKLIDVCRASNRAYKRGVHNLMTEAEAEMQAYAVDPKATSGLDAVLLKEKMLMIEQALCEMTMPHYRLAWILNKIEGYPQKQVAKMIGSTHNSVKVIVHRTNRYLRDYLTERGIQ